MKKAATQSETFSSRRVEALTDGVFAIAMTLLILDLNVGDFPHISSSADLWHALTDMSTGFAGFVISFLMLGSMWAVHTRQFEYVKAVDRHAVMINTLRLLTVVVMPLTTSIATSYPDVLLGKIILPLNFLALTIVSYWQWEYTAADENRLHKPMSVEDRRYAKFRNLSIIGLAVLTLLLSCFFGTLAFLVFVLANFVTRRHIPSWIKA